MAYIGQDKKKLIAAELKTIIPKTWKYSLAIRHHISLVLTIAAAPMDLLGLLRANTEYPIRTHHQLNPYWWKEHYKGAPEDLMALLKKVFAALNDGNFDDSDLMTDYLHVGWYVDVNIGRWNKPFVNTAGAMPEKAAA